MKKVYKEKEANEEIEKQALKELRRVSKNLFPIVNKRIDRLVNSNTVSPALEGLIKKRGAKHFTSGGKDLKALEKEVASAIAFYNRETSTVTGARHFTSRLQELIGNRIHDKDYINDVFDLMHGVAERVPVKLEKNMVGTNQILNEVIEEATSQNISAINSDEESRNEFITKLVKQLQKETKEAFFNGANDLERELKSQSSKIF